MLAADISTLTLAEVRNLNCTGVILIRRQGLVPILREQGVIGAALASLGLSAGRMLEMRMACIVPQGRAENSPGR